VESAATVRETAFDKNMDNFLGNPHEKRFVLSIKLLKQNVTAGTIYLSVK